MMCKTVVYCVVPLVAVQYGGNERDLYNVREEKYLNRKIGEVYAGKVRLESA